MNDEHLSPTAKSPKRYNSVGGWLLVFCIGLVILSPLGRIGNAYNNPFSVWETARVIRAGHKSVAGQVMSMEPSKREARKLIAEYKQNPELKKLFICNDIEQVVQPAVPVRRPGPGHDPPAARHWPARGGDQEEREGHLRFLGEIHQ